MKYIQTRLVGIDVWKFPEQSYCIGCSSVWTTVCVCCIRMHVAMRMSSGCVGRVYCLNRYTYIYEYINMYKRMGLPFLHNFAFAGEGYRSSRPYVLKIASELFSYENLILIKSTIKCIYLFCLLAENKLHSKYR